MYINNFFAYQYANYSRGVMNESKCRKCKKWKDAKRMKPVKDENNKIISGLYECFNCRGRKI